MGHCRDTRRFGTAGILCGWALHGYSAVGHCGDTCWLGTAGILGGWSLKSASSRARTTSTLKFNNPTARVGNNEGLGFTASECLENQGKTRELISLENRPRMVGIHLLHAQYDLS